MYARIVRAPASPVAVPAQSQPFGWSGDPFTPLWSDEFNSATVDTARWEYWYDYAVIGEPRRDAINTPANTFIDSGLGGLVVQSTKEDMGYGEGTLTAGGLSLANKNLAAGYYEVRAKILGGWFTTWLYTDSLNDHDGVANDPATYGTEMGICEACCPGAVSNAVHWNGYGANHQFILDPIDGVTQTDWNVYGLHWGSGFYDFYTNGVLKLHFTTAVSQRTDHYMIISQEWAGGGHPYDPQIAVVDYVRVWAP